MSNFNHNYFFIHHIPSQAQQKREIDYFYPMVIVPVSNDVQAAQFLKVPLIIYQNDANWIQPLDKDIQEVFDEKKNKAFRFGKIQRWILQADDGSLAGRIAAFVYSKYKNRGDDVKVGCMGFFECINNTAAAELLLDNAKHWLLQQGMEAMDGPVNFGERDRWWGLLTDGFTAPLYCMNYNPPYYQTLLEDYGFQVFYNQICLGMNAQEYLGKKIWERHDNLAADNNFSCKTIRKDEFNKFAEDFATVYNKAWAGHGDLKQLKKEQVLMMFRKMKPVMDEKLLFFAYYKNEPIAIFINIPDLNQWFKYLKGKFGLLQKLQFLWVKKFKPNKKFVGVVFGVVPEFQARGVDAYIIGQSSKVIQGPNGHYLQYEMQWIGDFNPKMINIAESLGHVLRTRNLVTYRYLFDRTKEFKRHPVLA